MADVVIRGGTILDGLGGEPFEADLAIDGSKISEIGENVPKGKEEIDATGKIVTPGFIDPHTHYDAQVTWSNSISPSSWNGVTTAMVGNCGVGFAPCKPDERDLLVKLMEGVEDIPEVVLTEGLPWNWESFEDYMDSLDGRKFDLDVVTQVPHAAVRTSGRGRSASAMSWRRWGKQWKDDSCIWTVSAAIRSFTVPALVSFCTMLWSLPCLRRCASANAPSSAS